MFSVCLRDPAESKWDSESAQIRGTADFIDSSGEKEKGPKEKILCEDKLMPEGRSIAMGRIG